MDSFACVDCQGRAGSRDRHAFRVRPSETTPGEKCGLTEEEINQRYGNSQSRHHQSHAGEIKRERERRKEREREKEGERERETERERERESIEQVGWGHMSMNNIIIVCIHTFYRKM